jgi:transposase
VNQTVFLAELIVVWSVDDYDPSMSTPTGRKPSPDDQPTLFETAGEEPIVAKHPAPLRGWPRLRTANRQQVVFRAASLDALIPHDHPARVVWDYVEGLDLSPLYDRIKSVERGPGRDAMDPKILMALWLYATVEGVGSARKLDELCREHAAFQWIAGDVSTNYHTLADFRTGHVELLDGLLTAGVAALVAEDLVDLNRVAQDGMRVRASAGAASFRRRLTLEEALAQAEAQVEALRAEVEEDPAASDRREKGARQRAARERAERIKAALERLPELEAKKKAGEKDKARCSTTDPQATVMKMADGGFRPAYNVQFATATDSQVIVGVDVETTGSDAGQMAPMVEQVKGRYETVPGEVLVDGGFAQHDQIEAVSAPELGCTVYAPVPKPKDSRVDRHAPKPGDSAAVAAWRQRMGTGQAKAIYKERAATAECVNAQARGRGLIHLLVRGLAKVKAIVLWHALAHNLLRAAALRAAAAGAT